MLQLRKPWDSQPQEVLDADQQFMAGSVWPCSDNPGLGVDSGASRNHLSSVAPPALEVRQRGKTYKYNGINTFLQTASAVSIGSQFTIIAWVQPAALNTSYSRIIESQFTTGFYLGSNTGSRYAFIVNNSSLEGCIGGQQVAGQLDMVAGVYDGTNRHLYVNGLLVQSAAAAAPSASTRLTVGRAGAGSVNFWNGDIDNVIYQKFALTGAQIQALYVNRYSAFAPRTIWVPVSAGGASPDGNASSAPASSTLTAPTATGSGSAQASTAPAGSTLTAPTATASASAQASGALAGASLTAPTATATGTTAGNATATGAPAGLTLTPPTATATGSAQASGAPAGATLTAPTGTASSAGHATASGAFSGATLTAPTGTATGSAQAFASFMAAVLTAPTGTATDAAPATDLELILKILSNRQELNPATGTFTLYDDDSTTVLYTASAWADAAGTIPYSGGALRRIDALA